MKSLTKDNDVKSRETLFFYAALFFAIFVSPFIGGIRGLPLNFLWLLFPLTWGFWTKQWFQLGLGAEQFKLKKLFKILAISFLTGIASGIFLLQINYRIPTFLNFILILPSLHYQMTWGNPWMLIVLIPVAHFVHEIFYRGYIQSGLTLIFSSAIPAIFFSSLLFGWTHVFVYNSLQKIPQMQSVTLFPVISFAFIESIIAGYLFYKTKNLLSPIAFRVANLILLSIILYRQYGLI